ncbi:heterokaryon incompatibility protein-domain-containing protein [Leptodontidium sp. MPI-SDFR-AT-0119]|nr:heterokaryon incompatibility protein-domain-containing protein [Leptodontidium sp. MPI-SDFR-AT-0119]
MEPPPPSAQSGPQDEHNSSLSSLCPTCQSVFIFAIGAPYHLWNPEHWFQPQKWHLSFKHLFDSLEAGACRLCMCIAGHITAYSRYVSQIQDLAHAGVVLTTLRSEAKTLLLVEWGDLNTEVGELRLEIEETLGHFKQLAPVPMYTDDPSTWNTILTWLDDCTTTLRGAGQAARVLHSGEEYDPETWRGYFKEHHPYHHNCHKACMEKILPSHLIDVAEHEVDIRIVQTEISAIDNEVRYAALSHCWGSSELMPIRTLKANVQNTPYDITYESLSKTFKDAVTITRKLGLRYVWIDSLCIVQDDVDDWNRESKKMGNIYANCYVNIVASDAADSSVGCFFHRSLSNDTGFRIAVTSSDQAHFRDQATQHTHPSGLPFLPEIQIRTPVSDIRASNGQDLKAIFTCGVSISSPSRLTSQRAWCFQETFLAPRSIFFGRDQVYWECRYVRASESIPEGFSCAGEAGSRFDLEREEGHLRQLLEWFKIVQEYSSRNLTYWYDRLPALSGIARAMYHKTPDIANREYSGKRRKDGPDYLAGLWNSHDLEKQLYWYRASNPEAAPSGPPNAPTWSWASVKGQISLIQGWHAMSLRTLHVISADIELATDDEFGSCRGGRLEVSCRGPFTATIVQSGELNWLRVGGTEYKELKVYLDEPLKSLDVFGVHGIYEDDPTGPVQDAGLLLQQMEEGKDTYRRVGIFVVNERDWRVNNFEWGCTLKNRILPTNSDIRIWIV